MLDLNGILVVVGQEVVFSREYYGTIFLQKAVVCGISKDGVSVSYMQKWLGPVDKVTRMRMPGETVTVESLHESRQIMCL